MSAELVWEHEVVSLTLYQMANSDPQVRGAFQSQRLAEVIGQPSTLGDARKILARHKIRNVLLPRGLEEGPPNVPSPKAVLAQLKSAQLERLRKRWGEKPIHGAFPRQLQMPETDATRSNLWLTRGQLTADTEAVVVAAQDRVTPVRKYLVEVREERGNVACRACRKEPESLGHVLSMCLTMAWTLYKERHDRMLHVLVREVGLALGVNLPGRRRAPGGIAETGVVRGRDVIMQVDAGHPTDRQLEARRPDLVVTCDV